MSGFDDCSVCGEPDESCECERCDRCGAVVDFANGCDCDGPDVEVRGGDW